MLPFADTDTGLDAICHFNVLPVVPVIAANVPFIDAPVDVKPVVVKVPPTDIP